MFPGSFLVFYMPLAIARSHFGVPPLGIGKNVRYVHQRFLSCADVPW